MKFKTFRCLALVAMLVASYGVWRLATTSAGSGVVAPNLASSQSVVQVASPAKVVSSTVKTSSAPVVPPPPASVQVRVEVVQAPPAPATIQAQAHTANVGELKAKIGGWLNTGNNKYRHGKKKLEDFLPNESFRATLVRFEKVDADKWSDNEGHWSQVRIDLNKDGKDDEKWLLKNGGLYKREVLDSAGKTTYTEYFSK